jgi:hypothetical protein
MHNVTRVRSRLALVASVSTALEVFVSESSRTRRPPEEQRSLLRAPWREAQREGTMKRCSADPRGVRVCGFSCRVFNRHRPKDGLKQFV